MASRSVERSLLAESLPSFLDKTIERDSACRVARGEDSAYEGDTCARRKFLIKPLKETDLGVAQAFFDH